MRKPGWLRAAGLGLLLALVAPAALAKNVPGAPQARARENADVARVVRHNLAQVKLCFEREALAGRAQSGKAVVNLSITAEGDVVEVRIEAPELAGSQLAPCLRSHAQRWHFPRSRAPRFVSYPIVFMAG